MENNEKQEFSYFVIVEWGGKKPSMTWYDTIHRMGLYRDEYKDDLEEQGVYARRNKMGRKMQNGKQPKGLVVQEGVYLLRSSSLAGRVMAHARRFGARNVMSGHLTPGNLMMGDADVAAIVSIITSETRRGRRPSGDAGTYSVTCLDEVTTVEIEVQHLPMDCPSCGSIRIQVSKGKVPIFGLPKDIDAQSNNEDIYNFWKNSRFDGEKFAIPIVRYSQSMNQPGEHFKNPKTSFIDVKLPDIVAATGLDFPQQLIDDMDVDLKLQLRVYDLLYVLSQVEMRQEPNLRSASRIEVLSGYWNSANNPKPYLMSAPDSGVDIVDLCIHDNSLTKYL